MRIGFTAKASYHANRIQFLQKLFFPNQLYLTTQCRTDLRYFILFFLYNFGLKYQRVTPLRCIKYMGIWQRLNFFAFEWNCENVHKLICSASICKFCQELARNLFCMRVARQNCLICIFQFWRKLRRTFKIFLTIFFFV